MIRFLCLIMWLPGTVAWGQPSKLIDLSAANILIAENQGAQAKAAEMLQEEVEERTGISPAISTNFDSKETPTIHLLRVDQASKDLNTGSVPDLPEGFSIWVDGSDVYLVGRDDRGVLFAVGKLLRLLTMMPGSITLSSNTLVTESPKYPIRGHQMGYRHTANTYDAWEVETYEQYIRDLICFGTNSIELITALDPTETDGPVMETPQWEMNLKLAELVHSYGLDVWFWMPLDGDVTDPEVSQQEIEARERFFEACPAIDHLMVPGGDPGRTTPAVLMPWLEQMSEVLHRHFPEAGIWVSNQKFKPEENDVFFNYLHQHHPDWLTGVAFGPGTLITLKETRERTPEQFRLRRYPDITHCVRCQYPVPEWDGIFAQTLGREPPNPRPHDTSHTHNVWAHLSDGFVSYSDGAHDDLNKMLWSALGWNPETDIDEVLNDYGRLLFGESLGADIAKGLIDLEKNWRGPILENDGIEQTYHHWRDIGGKNGELLRDNWRYQMYLFRSLFDYYIQVRHEVEMGYQGEAYGELAKAAEIGSTTAIARAQRVLAKADSDHVRTDLRSQIEFVGVTLHQLIGYQMSVRQPFLARNPERGALLDKADRPLNDRPWLEDRFNQILQLEVEEDRLIKINEIIEWENPRPGGYYDDLGNAVKQPHLVRQTTWHDDPMYMTGPQEAHYRSMNNESMQIPPKRFSWLDQAQTLYGVPLKMHYEGLDPKAKYRIRITHYGRYHAPTKLVADGIYEIHGAMKDSDPVWPVEFPIPPEATRDGVLDLDWELVEGRGCQVAEVWLLKN